MNEKVRGLGFLLELARITSHSGARVGEECCYDDLNDESKKNYVELVGSGPVVDVFTVVCQVDDSYISVVTILIKLKEIHRSGWGIR